MSTDPLRIAIPSIMAYTQDVYYLTLIIKYVISVLITILILLNLFKNYFSF